MGQSEFQTIYFYWRNSNIKYGLQINNNFTVFTGQHLSFSESISPKHVSNVVGLIVVSTGKTKTHSKDMKISRGDINNAHPMIKLSTKPYQKSVYGVISNYSDDKPVLNEGKLLYDDELNISPFHNDLYGRIRINSLGEGCVWVINENGNIENGDYITTSSLHGYGMKQDDDILKNFTVAKSTVDCNFIKQQKYKQMIKHSITYDDTEAKTYHIEYDENGITQFEDLDEIEYEFEMRWFKENNEITEEEYNLLLEENTSNLYIGCLIPCTYHCG
jgi:hypothetical protein